MLALLCALTLVTLQPAHAQTLRVLHTFTGSPDGAHPANGVVLDQAGNLYGITYDGGIDGNGCTALGTATGCGTVYKLTKHGSDWLYATLYKFQGPPDGNYPAGVVFGPDGALYGTTTGGGIVNNGGCSPYENGCGTVFRLRPPATFCPTPLCPWNENLLYTFAGTPDGANPYNGNLVFNTAGDIYGTTVYGGVNGYGAAYELAPTQGGYSESIIYNFNKDPDALASPYTGLIMDASGNLYGTTSFSNAQVGGTVYQLVQSQAGWTANILQSFQCISGPNPGCFPQALIFDSAGNLLLGNYYGGFYDRGTVIKLLASNNWSVDLLYTFTLEQGVVENALTTDAAGNIYGTAAICDDGNGCVFKLTPSLNGYTYTLLYDFMDGTDGQHPYGPVAIDAEGNLYGTATNGGFLDTCTSQGDDGCGVVWEISPE